jgi:YD repeat-containing protein
MHWKKRDMKTLLALIVLLQLTICLNAQTCDLTRKIVSIEGRMDTTFYEHDRKTHLVTEILRPQTDGGHLRETYQVGEGRVNRMQTTNFSFAYFHDDDNRVIGYIVYDDLNVSNFFYTLDYDDQGRLVKYTGFETPFLSDTVVSEFTRYHWEGDKMVKMEEYSSYPDSNSLPTATTTFEYSDHINPEYNPLYGSNRPFKYVITKQTYSDSDGVYDPYSFTRECTYNKQGYPVKCISHYLDGSEVTENYTYKCK